MTEPQIPPATEEKALTKDDFVPAVDVRWCPGCGDYSILNSIQATFPQLGIARENFVIVSGIGCSSRFPYYMNTYGFHSIHGRAPTVATGVKALNPDLSVWLVTGDGDGLSIGGNHLLHLLRRNPDIKVLLFNNRIYGLTKGQYSPTSEVGKKTKSSPMGTIETPLNPLCFALAAEATFVARTIDTNPKHMQEVFKAAAEHKGTAFIEIMQNCVIFNNKTWAPIAGREVREEQTLMMQAGQPLLFGKENKKGIRLNGLRLEKVVIGEEGVTEKDILVHNPQELNPSYAYLLTQMSYPELPTPMGIFRDIQRPVYEEMLAQQIIDSTSVIGRKKNLQSLLLGSDYWEVGEDRKSIHMPDMGQKKQEVDEEFKIMDEQANRKETSESDPLVRALRTRLAKVREQYQLDRIKTLSPNDPVAKAISHFKAYHVGCMLVVDGKKLEGIITERDIVRKVCLKDIDINKTPVSQIMTTRPDHLSDSSTVGTAINRLSIGHFRHLPIIDKNGDFSVISYRQLLGFLYDQVHK